MTTSPKDLELVASYLTRLENDRVQVTTLLQGFEKDLAVLKTHTQIPADSAELQQLNCEIFEQMRSTKKMIERWIIDLDEELGRVKKAYVALGSNDVEMLQAHFANFIVSDASLSVKNNAMMFYDMNDVWQSFKYFIHSSPIHTQRKRKNDED